MKPFKALLLSLLVFGACEKADDVGALRDEAQAITKYYSPRIDALQARVEGIYQRGRNVPANLPDIPKIVEKISVAKDKVGEMRGVANGVQGQIDAAGKGSNTRAELEKLIDETHEKLDADMTEANEALNEVEGWLWQVDQARMAPPASAPLPPSPNNEGEPPPATPEGAGAGSGGAAKGADKADKKAGEHADKADKADKAAGEKADKKAGDHAAGDKADKKTTDKAEKKATDKKPADKAAADKAAGSAAH